MTELNGLEGPRPPYVVKWVSFCEAGEGPIYLSGVGLFGGLICGTAVYDMTTASSPTYRNTRSRAFFAMIVKRGTKVASVIVDGDEDSGTMICGRIKASYPNPVI